MGQGADEAYQSRFGGIGRLYGVRALSRFRGAHVAVVGVGGVGSWSVEALARSGVGRLTLIDLDDVCINNTNRQLHAMEGQLGKLKIEVLSERARQINPAIEVIEVADFFTPTTADALLSGGFDVVIDAIDDLHNKALLIAQCRERGLHVVTVGGAGGRRDPTQITTGDLSQSGQDGLLRSLRKRLREVHGLPKGQTPWDIPCVYTREKAIYPTADGEVCHTPPAGEALRLDCAVGFGAATFVTGTMGFIAASLALDHLAARPS